MRGLWPACVGILILAVANPADAKAVSVTDGTVQMQVTDEPVQVRCVVTVSSGSHALDRDACSRALAALPADVGGLPEGAYLFPGPDRRYADGSCVLANGTPVPAGLAASCASLIQHMGKARVAMAVDPDRWVRAGDVARGVGGASGPLNVSIGIGADGKASYCVPIRSSGNAAADQAVCAAVQKRARFESALDAAGNPIPAVYARHFVVAEAQ